MQENEGSSPVPLDKVIKQLYEAASSDSWRPGPHIATKPIPISLTSASHVPFIRRSLDRAARKSFVRAVKPLRRLLRNQGAVNDSMLQALFHLFSQGLEMIEEMSELQRRISNLEAQVRELQPQKKEPDKPFPGE